MATIGRATQLAILAILGQFVAYGLSIVVARRLGVDDFEAYAVGSSIFMLMVVYVPRGVEKYSIKILPGLIERGDFGAAKGFLIFGLRRVLIMSGLVGGGVYIWTTFVVDYPRGLQIAIMVSCLSLPIGALAHYGIEILSAFGRDIAAIGLFRIVVPSVTLALVGLLVFTDVDISGAMVVGCWGLAWAVIFALMIFPIWRSPPQNLWTATATKDSGQWRRGARPFLHYRISMALLTQIGILILDRFNSSAAAVGAYSVALGTVSLILVLATGTNRFYSRKMSIFLEQKDYQGMLDVRRERLLWLLPCTVIFLIAIFGFGREILHVFRPEFVEEGILALYILSISTVVSLLFSLAPTYLKFRDHSRAILKVVAGAAGLNVVLNLLLVPEYAAAGAATAYAVSMCGMYFIFSRMANQELIRLKAGS